MDGTDGILFPFLVIACLGIITGLIAESKGRSFLGWWVYGAALFIVALPHAILLKPNTDGDFRKCPFCVWSII